MYPPDQKSPNFGLDVIAFRKFCEWICLKVQIFYLYHINIFNYNINY